MTQADGMFLKEDFQTIMFLKEGFHTIMFLKEDFHIIMFLKEDFHTIMFHILASILTISISNTDDNIF